MGSPGHNARPLRRAFNARGHHAPEPISGSAGLRGGRTNQASRLPPNVRRIDPLAGRVLGERRAAHRVDQAVHPRQGRELRRAGLPHSLVLRRHPQRGGELLGPPPRETRRQDGHHLGSGRSAAFRAPDLSRAAPARLPVRECLESARCAQGRPHHHLSADDSRDRHHHARVCAARCRALHRVRGVLRRSALRTHRGLRLDAGHHGRRRAARRQAHRSQGLRR